MAMNNEVKLFDITDLAIEELKERYSGLTINGLDDKEGYQAVKAARIVMKGYRVDVDKRRKELNEDALAHQRRINGEAKRITEKLSEIEDYLASEEKKIDDAIAAIKAEEFRKLEVRKQYRIDSLVACGLRFNGMMFTSVNQSGGVPLVIVQNMTDLEFDALLAEEMEKKAEDDRKRAEFQAQQELQAAEAKAAQEKIDAELKEASARMKEEQDRAYAQLAQEREKLAAMQAEQEAKAKALAEQERAIKAESERLENEKKCKEASEQMDKFAPTKPEPVSIPDNVREITQKHYLIEICGQFKVSTYAYAENSEAAKEIAFGLLNNGELDIDFEHSDCQVYEK